nr:MAG TPA: hypothetical protein [Caudoviricetes sp.]
MKVILAFIVAPPSCPESSREFESEKQFIYYTSIIIQHLV